MGSEPRWNLRRGLNRAFVVFAVCWYILAGFVLWPQWTTAIEAKRNADTDVIIAKYGGKPARTSASVDEFMAQVHARELRPIKLTVFFSLVPPAIYGLAAAVFWIVRGFRAP